MTKKQEPTTDLDAVKRPDIEALGETPTRDYVLWLEERLELLQNELEAKPGAQSRGIFWIDLFGTVPHPYMDDIRLQVKGNFTQRSDVDALQATRIAFNGLRAIKGEFNLVPWITPPPPANGKRKPERKAAPDAQAQDKEPEPEPSGRKRKRRTDDTPSQTKTPEPIGDEEWYQVKSLDLGQTMDKTQKVLHVRCGRWHKHGVSAYLDSANIPEGVLTMIENGDWTVEDQPVQGDELTEDFPDMKYALVATEGEFRKVVGFAEAPPQ